MSQGSSKRTNLSRYFRPVPSSLKIGSEISRGSYGFVHEGELDGRPVAVKKIHRILLEAAKDGAEETLEKMVTDFEKECRLLEELKHTHVVGFSGAFYDVRNEEPVLVMERMKENLRDLLRREKQLSLRRQLQISLEIATALEYLHSRSPPAVHRDLTDKNVMLSEEGVAKLGDLGQAKLKDNSVEYFSTGQPGAVPFMPPEALRDEPHYTEKIDIFSLGVLMLEICTGHFPSVKLSGIGVVSEIVRRREDLSRLADGHPLKLFILLCLRDDYRERPPANIVCIFLKSHVEHENLLRDEMEGHKSAVKELEKSLRDETKRHKSAVEELVTTKEMLSKERKRCEGAVKEFHTIEELLHDEMERRKSAVKELDITEKMLSYERERCQNAFKELDATKELLNDGLKRCESAVKELDATKELLNDGRKRCENAVKTQQTASGSYQNPFKEPGRESAKSVTQKSPELLKKGGTVGGIPARAKAKTEPIRLLRNASQADKDRKKYTIIVIGCSGRGKSTFCNFLFREKRFVVENPIESKVWGGVMSTLSKAPYGVIRDPIAGVDLHIVDTPGYLATQHRTGSDSEDMAKDGEMVLQEFANALIHAKDGIDAIFVTLKAGERVAKEEELLMEFIEKLNLWQHCILLFTHGQGVGDKEEDRYQGFYKLIKTDEFKRNCPVLVKMLSFTNNKFVIVESVHQQQDGKYYYSKLHEIIQAVAVVRDKLGTVINHPLLRMARTCWEMYMKREKLEQELQSEGQEKRIITERFKKHLNTKEMELAQVQTELQDKKQKLKETEVHISTKEMELAQVQTERQDKKQKLKEMEDNPGEYVDVYSESEAVPGKQEKHMRSPATCRQS